MTKQSSSIAKLILPSFVIWLVPLIISFFFFDRQGELAINFWLFKAIMFVVGFSTAYFVLSKHYKKHNYTWLTSSIAILVYNIILDLIVIVGLLGTGIGEYFLTIATVYLIFIPLSNYLVMKKLATTKESTK